MTGELDAGPFRPWLARTLRVLQEGTEAEVPCGDCTACCESAQFVLVEPGDEAARAAIPAELLFPAPGAPPGFAVLPYDEAGRCPMLRDGGCSIYEDRPRTCRAYDCRVLAAAAVEPGPGKAAIAARVARWRFESEDGESEADTATLGQIAGAARFLADHPDGLPGGSLPPTQRAALALEVHDLFDETGSPRDPAAVLVEVRRRLAR